MIQVPIFISLLAALFTSPVILFAHIFFIRVSKKGKVRLMMYAFILYIIVWFSLSIYLLGIDTSFLTWIVAGASLVGFLCLGYAEFFSMLSRGFSLQILVDIYSHDTQTSKQLLYQYGGKGIAWMLQKRIHTLESLGIVEQKGDTLLLKQLGAVIGRAGIMIKHLLNLGKGG